MGQMSKVEKWYRNYETGCFMFGKYLYGRGITTEIQKQFFPAGWSLFTQAGSTRGGGCDKGKQVDNELRAWTHLVNRPRVKPETIAKHVATYCVETCAIINEFQRRGWTPVNAQLVVGCRRSRWATAIDMVAREVATDQLVLLEIKTGYEGTFQNELNNNKHRMKLQDGKWAATPLRFAWIQILWGWVLYCKSHPRSALKLPFRNVAVINVVDSRVNVFPLPLDFAKSVLPLLNNMHSVYVESQRLKPSSSVCSPSSSVSPDSFSVCSSSASPP